MFERIQQWLDPVPEPVLGLLVLSIAAAFVWATLVDWRKERSTRSAEDPTAPSGHDRSKEPPEPAAACHEHRVGATKGGNRHGH